MSGNTNLPVENRDAMEMMITCPSSPPHLVTMKSVAAPRGKSGHQVFLGCSANQRRACLNLPANLQRVGMTITTANESIEKRRAIEAQHMGQMTMMYAQLFLQAVAGTSGGVELIVGRMKAARTPHPPALDMPMKRSLF